MTDHTSVARFVGIVLDKNGQAAAIANVRVWIQDVPKGNWGAEFFKANRSVATVLYALVAIKNEVTGDGIDLSLGLFELLFRFELKCRWPMRQMASLATSRTAWERDGDPHCSGSRHPRTAGFWRSNSSFFVTPHAQTFAPL